MEWRRRSSDYQDRFGNHFTWELACYYDGIFGLFILRLRNIWLARVTRWPRAIEKKMQRHLGIKEDDKEMGARDLNFADDILYVKRLLEIFPGVNASDPNYVDPLQKLGESLLGHIKEEERGLPAVKHLIAVQEESGPMTSSTGRISTFVPPRSHSAGEHPPSKIAMDHVTNKIFFQTFESIPKTFIHVEAATVISVNISINYTPY